MVTSAEVSPVTKITGLPARRSDAGRNQPKGSESAEKYGMSAGMAGSHS
jgi:hypothetical protein